MSTEPAFVLDVIDGENMLALLGQLIDVARGLGEDRKPFKVTVRRKVVTDKGVPIRPTRYHKAEIGLYVHVVEVGDDGRTRFQGFIEEASYYKDRNLADPYPMWLRTLIKERDSSNIFTAAYNANKRTGDLAFDQLFF